MRKTLLATAVGITALIVSSPQPVDRPRRCRSTVRRRELRDLVQRGGAAAIQPRHEISAFFLVRSGQGDLRGSRQGGSKLRHGPLGRRAYSFVNNPHIAIPAANLAPGLAAIQKAKAMNAQTERERDYIDALAVMYVDHDKLTHRQRISAFLKATEALAAKYPKDDEAQIAYAITLNTSASSTDKTYAQQTKGAAILEPISKRLPQHPGVTHYLIHLYDYPETAQKGLDAANRYAKIAPAAPHAQHMPSHIYTRVGYWNELIASNDVSRRRRRGPTRRPEISCTDKTIWSMPICSSARTSARALSWTT